MPGPVGLQRPEFSAALARVYGLKGDVRLGATGDVVPTMPVLSALDRSPYSRIGLPFAAWGTIAALAANYSHLALGVPVGLMAQIRRIIITNTSASGLFRIGLGNRTIFTSFAWGTFAGGGSYDITNYDSDITTGAGPAIRTLHNAAGVFTTDLTSFLYVTTNSNFVLDFPEDLAPVVSGGNGSSLAPNGTVGVQSTIVNFPLSVSMFGRVWPMPG